MEHFSENTNTIEDKKDIRSMYFDELLEEVKSRNLPAFRGKQIYEWIHKKCVSSFEEMTNLPLDMRQELADGYTMRPLRLVEEKVSQIDGTRKYLFSLYDGNVIESVWMQYKHGNSVCISSQVGCRMGCRFCASTLDGMVRCLSASEMLGQIYMISLLTGERVSNVVIMGSGEPLDNYDNVLRFLRLISDEHGLNISQRNLTLSTCGLVDKMKQLATEKLQITLAISLHAATDEKRKQLMPIANKYSLSQLMDACRYYEKMTGRRETFEYSLVAGVNDSMEDAKNLATLLRGMNAHVNLIPVNPVKERGFMQPDKAACLAFQNKLEKMEINVTIRREMGRDIDGACGQLRRSYLQSAE